MEGVFPDNQIQQCAVGTGSQTYSFLKICSDFSTKECSYRFVMQLCHLTKCCDCSKSSSSVHVIPPTAPMTRPPIPGCGCGPLPSSCRGPCAPAEERK